MGPRYTQNGMAPAMGTSCFQLTSDLGYLDIEQLVIPRHFCLWQPRGRAEIFYRVQDMEEILMRHGGAWWRHRFRIRFPEAALAVIRNLAVAQCVTALAIEQGEYNHLEDDDPQHLEQHGAMARQSPLWPEVVATLF